MPDSELLLTDRAGGPPFSFKMERRPDGGLRIWSTNPEGVVLSGADPKQVVADLWGSFLFLEGNATRANPCAAEATRIAEVFKRRADAEERLEVTPRARRLYIEHCDNAGIHSNRFPGWDELTDEQREPWVQKAIHG